MFCCVETIYRRITLYTSKDREKNTFSDDLTGITLSAVKKSANLNNNPRMSSCWAGHRERARTHDISTRPVRQSMNELRDQYN